MAKPWTKEEDERLRKLWPESGSKCASEFPDRTLSSVRNRSKQLKVTRVGLLWTPEEDAIIKEYYFSEGKAIQTRLPDRTIESIYTRATTLGVLRDTTPEQFTEDESRIIEEWYHKDKDKMYTLLPEHTKEGCKREARRLGLLKEFDGVPWTSEEEQYLIEHYPTEGTACFSHFPNRTVLAIRRKLNKLGVCLDEEHQIDSVKNRVPWTDEEDEIVKAYYPVEGIACHVRIPAHTASACKSRAKMLRVFYDRSKQVLPTGEPKPEPEFVPKGSVRAGMKKGRLTVIAPADFKYKNGQLYWRCSCECGKEVIVSSSYLRRGTTQSCGCLAAEIRSTTFRKYAESDEGKEMRKRNSVELPYRMGMLEGTNASSHLSGYIRKDNPTGVRGVGITKAGRFTAYIKFKGVMKHLGVYDTLDEAARARRQAELELEPELQRIMSEANDNLNKMHEP